MGNKKHVVCCVGDGLYVGVIYHIKVYSIFFKKLWVSKGDALVANRNLRNPNLLKRIFGSELTSLLVKRTIFTRKKGLCNIILTNYKFYLRNYFFMFVMLCLLSVSLALGIFLQAMVVKVVHKIMYSD